MADASRFPQLAYPFAVVGAAAGWLSAGFAVAMLTAFGIVFALVPRALASVFSDDPAIVSLASRTFLVTAAAQPFMAFATVAGMSLRGAGDTRTVLGVTVWCAVLVRLAATWFFAITLGLGIVGVWMGSTSDWVCRSVMLGIAYARGRWRGVRV